MTLVKAYAKVRPACVAIALEGGDETNFSFNIFGSGVCVDNRGLIVTAKHVVTDYYEKIKGEQVIYDKEPSSPEFIVMFSRRTESRYEIFYNKPTRMWLLDNSDVAVLRIPEVPGGWPSVVLPDKFTTWEGSSVGAAGFPLRSAVNQDPVPNLFSGIVSQVSGQYIDDKGFRIDSMILDLSIHPGNSGGPVFDPASGQLVGIVSAHKTNGLYYDDAIQNEFLEYVAKQYSVWTNITMAVPWTVFAAGLNKLLEQQ